MAATPTPPSPDVIAAQLRKPSGSLASVTAQNMDKTNAPLYDLTLQSMDMDLKGDERVLEIGFGSGSFMDKLFSHRDHLQVTGVDYTPEIVQMAEISNDDLVRSGRLRLEEASSNRLPF